MLRKYTKSKTYLHKFLHEEDWNLNCCMYTCITWNVDGSTGWMYTSRITRNVDGRRLGLCLAWCLKSRIGTYNIEYHIRQCIWSEIISSNANGTWRSGIWKVKFLLAMQVTTQPMTKRHPMTNQHKHSEGPWTCQRLKAETNVHKVHLNKLLNEHYEQEPKLNNKTTLTIYLKNMG